MQTIETHQRLKQANVMRLPPIVLLNRATPPSLTQVERSLLQRLSQVELSPEQQEFVGAARWEDGLEQGTKNAIERLESTFSSQPILVPLSSDIGQPRKVVGSVAVHLGRKVGVTRRELAWT